MPRDPRAGGFTLIEILVVIGILSLLIVAFAPDIFRMGTAADKAADQANLRWHYQQFTHYYNNHQRALPPGTGHRFVLYPWCRNLVQKTPENFERYWTPGVQEERKNTLKEIGLENIWQSVDEVTSLDTHYAGPGPELKRQRLWGNGELPMMANDNEFGPAFPDHTINMLVGSGVVRPLLLDEHLMEYGFTGEEGEVFPVGEGSPHPDLAKLEK